MVQPSSRNGPWLKRVLIPFWVFQIFIEVVFCIAAVVALSEGFEDDSAQSAYVPKSSLFGPDGIPG